jgi:hypothetical protein
LRCTQATQPTLITLLHSSHSSTIDHGRCEEKVTSIPKVRKYFLHTAQSQLRPQNPNFNKGPQQETPLPLPAKVTLSQNPNSGKQHNSSAPGSNTTSQPQDATQHLSPAMLCNSAALECTN